MNLELEKRDLKNLSINELHSLVLSFKKEKYRVSQILRWLYKNGVDSIDKMSNLPKDFRQKLAEIFFISQLNILKVEESKDGTKKFLFGLKDGERIESVLIPKKKRLTLCISSQVGCAMGCKFCLTGKMGLKRNLTLSEILNQILMVKENLFNKAQITNIVFMGMGEPLDNYENIINALEIMLSQDAFNFSSRKVTISTVGLIPELERLAKENIRFRLAISLNATTEEIRSYLMPINKHHPLSEILNICRRYPLRPRERITFEYVLLEGENDSPSDAKRLLGLLSEIPSKVNLIPLNEAQEIPFKRPSEKRIREFQKILLERNLTAIVRTSKGSDISAACGQLQGKYRN